MSKKKKVLIISILALILISILVLTAVAVYNTFYKEQENSSQVAEISNGSIFTKENMPRVDASTATQPLVTAVISNFIGEDLSDEEIDYTNTHSAYERLIAGEKDLIVVTEPSKEELELAKQSGIELEVIPVAREGFVFFVNKDNPVKNLSLEQIQKIYTGEITNWKQLGGNDAEIQAYQRPVNSGSQTGILSLVMNGREIKPPKEEEVVDTMRGIVSIVADYDNGINSIGYSYYYYATTMYDTLKEEGAGKVKLLLVNNVEPTYETIQNETYPIKTAYYIVFNKKETTNSDTRKLANAMLSEEGQQIVEKAGYVRLNGRNFEEKENVYRVNDDAKGIQSLEETYNENDLEFIDIDPNENIDKIQIKGLKNIEVQNKINAELAAKTDEYIKKANTYDDSYEKNINAQISASFSDVISVVISIDCLKHSDYSDESRFVEVTAFNYRLDTGGKLYFNDLFTSSADVKTLLTKAIYKEFAFVNLNMQLTGGDANKTDVEKIVMKFLLAYEKNELNFYFTDEYVDIYLNDEITLESEVYSFKFEDIYQDIAIFNRFKTEESLYTKEEIGEKEITVFSGKWVEIQETNY